MAILDTITSIENNLTNAYDVCQEKGATIPAKKNLANLADAINSIDGKGSTGIYGVAIDITNSNPETSVIYTDDAVGMTGGSQDWDNTPIFKNIKPCVLKNGEVQYYLNPNDYTKKEDGTSADITSGNDGDVMIEIPKLYYQINTFGNLLTVKVTDKPNNEGFHSYAHTRDEEGDRNKLYIGVYEGFVDSNNKLRSLSDKMPTGNKSLATFRGIAHSNGEGYDCMSYHPLVLLQCLYLIRYKNLNSQEALGYGYANASGAENTGKSNTNGMYYGTTAGTDHVKFVGIEDLYGGIKNALIDGVGFSSSGQLCTAFTNFNDALTGYDKTQFSSGTITGHIKSTSGTTETGFFPRTVGGSTTTYYCDIINVYSGRQLYYGGRWAGKLDIGIFHMSYTVNNGESADGWGARLMYL